MTIWHIYAFLGKEVKNNIEKKRHIPQGGIARYNLVRTAGWFPEICIIRIKKYLQIKNIVLYLRRFYASLTC